MLLTFVSEKSTNFNRFDTGNPSISEIDVRIQRTFLRLFISHRGERSVILPPAIESDRRFRRFVNGSRLDTSFETEIYRYRRPVKSRSGLISDAWPLSHERRVSPLNGSMSETSVTAKSNLRNARRQRSASSVDTLVQEMSSRRNLVKNRKFWMSEISLTEMSSHRKLFNSARKLRSSTSENRTDRYSKQLKVFICSIACRILLLSDHGEIPLLAR